ncbi:GerMN domain-containing protein [Alkalicoccus saliphilus]|uniref:GerMN domain-containing protein n=1 Tax=Alkalicoccus saliphilus TaxID=200989 RepID=A0A2T4U5D4_9BACI|nr:GerMN domain-containing protein [Alkalicoccus saliphilus]PTL38594.1 hypothetical protein C6Y45_10430 [Alkalicoccus saliphilus]
MKKMSFVLISALTIGGLTACGQGGESPVDENTDKNTGGADEVEENLNEINEENNSGGSIGENNNNENSENENDTNTNNQEDNGNNMSDENNEHNDSNDNSNENSSNTDENYEEENEEVNNASNEENASEEEADEEASMVDPLYLYFSDDQLLETLRVEAEPVTMDESGAEEAMDLWAAGPDDEELYGVFPAEAEVQYVELDGDTANVSLSPEVQNANLGSSGEGLMTEQIAMMMEQFGAAQTMILIDGDETEEFLGHMSLTEPVEADSPEDYDTH